MNTIKTYGDLLDKLIPLYEKAVVKLNKKEDFQKYLESHDLHYGICAAAYSNYNIVTRYTDFESNFSKGNTWLCELPLEQQCKEDAIKLLQMRVVRMKEIYYDWKDTPIDKYRS